MNPTEDRKALLSTLWIFTALNYIFADIFVLIFSPAFYQRAAVKTAGSTVLGLAVLVELLIAMVLLSRVLPNRASRWGNIIAGLLGSAFVAYTLSAGPPSHYMFFSSLEIACTLFIVGYAWTWRIPQGAP